MEGEHGFCAADIVGGEFVEEEHAGIVDEDVYLQSFAAAPVVKLLCCIGGSKILVAAYGTYMVLLAD